MPLETSPKTCDAGLVRPSLIYRRVMPFSRPMGSVATGVEELRIKDRSGAYRVFYYTKLSDSILVFHAFTKKTQQTPPNEIAIAQKRLKEMLE